LTAVLEIDKVSKSFGGIVALKEVDIEVRQGEILAIIGPNGSGKTTLLNLITGVYVPSSGVIKLGGQRMDNYTPSKICISGIARTFQNVRIFKGLSVLDNVLVGQHHRFTSSLAGILFKSRSTCDEETAFRDEALKLLETVGLKGKEKMVAQNLPYAQQRLLEIARALAARPQILLLDEPAAGMNSEEISHLSQLIKKLRQTGLTIILIEHIMDLVRGVADRVVVLSYGVKIATGTFEEIESNPLVIEAYLGKGTAKNVKN
jgi:ABC-type branched-subunit amino acid transport system ATPase component